MSIFSWHELPANSERAKIGKMIFFIINEIKVYELRILRMIMG
jgi:hypothetical protein